MALTGELTPVDFVMRSGDTTPIEVTVKDEDGTVFNLTGATITWALFEDALTTVAAILTKTIGSGITVVDAVNGRFDVAIVPADTVSLAGIFYHEVEVVDGSSNKKTVMVGTITIEKDQIV